MKKMKFFADAQNDSVGVYESQNDNVEITVVLLINHIISSVRGGDGLLY